MLFRGGLRDADVLLAEFDAVGLGVEDILIAGSSGDMSDMLSAATEVMLLALRSPMYALPIPYRIAPCRILLGGTLCDGSNE